MPAILRLLPVGSEVDHHPRACLEQHLVPKLAGGTHLGRDRDVHRELEDGVLRTPHSEEREKGHQGEPCHARHSFRLNSVRGSSWAAFCSTTAVMITAATATTAPAPTQNQVF